MPETEPRFRGRIPSGVGQRPRPSAATNVGQHDFATRTKPGFTRNQFFRLRASAADFESANPTRKTAGKTTWTIKTPKTRTKNCQPRKTWQNRPAGKIPRTIQPAKTQSQNKAAYARTTPKPESVEQRMRAKKRRASDANLRHPMTPKRDGGQT